MRCVSATCESTLKEFHHFVIFILVNTSSVSEKQKPSSPAGSGDMMRGHFAPLTPKLLPEVLLFAKKFISPPLI